MDLTAILSGVTGVGNAIGQGANLAQTLEQWRRYNERVDDPLFTQIRNRFINQANESPYGPYGDPSDSFGGIFGQDAAGKPVQYGDWASRQYMNMMQNNPVNAALSVLQQGANMRSPGVMSIQDILAGNFSGNPQSQPYTGMNFSMPAMPSLSPVDVNGIRTPAPQEPMLDEAKPGHSSGFLETLFGSGGSQNNSAPKPASAPTAPQQAPISARTTPQGGAFNPHDIARQLFMPGSGSFYNLPGMADRAMSGLSRSSGPVRGSYATGTPYVPQTGTYQLHQGEAVIPKTANPVAQPTNNVSIPYGIRKGLMSAGTPVMENLIGRLRGQGTTAQAQPQQPATTPQTGGYMGGQDVRRPRPARTEPVGVGLPTNQPATAPEAGLATTGAQQYPMPQQQAPYRPYQNNLPQYTQPTQYTPAPQAQAPAPQSPITQAATNNLSYLLKNPESMSSGVQAQMYNQAADSRDRMLQDQQRQINEAMGARGMGNSGLRYSLQNQAMNARNTDLTDALRNISTQAAQTNFGNRLDVANAALGQQQFGLQRELGLGGLGLQGRQLDIQRELGLGGLGLEGRGLDIQRELGLGGLGVQRELGLGNIGLGQQQLASQHQLGTAAAALQQQDLANRVFQQDRQYNSQLASQIAQLGQLGMSGNIGLMEALGNLINSGMGFNNQQLAQILQQGYQAYAGPDYAAFAYAPNPYVQAQQQNSGGGSNSELWGTLADSAMNSLSGPKPWVFGGGK